MLLGPLETQELKIDDLKSEENPKVPVWAVWLLSWERAGTGPEPGFKPCGDRIFSDLAPRLIFQSGIQAPLRKSLSNVSNVKIFLRRLCHPLSFLSGVYEHQDWRR